MLKNKFFIIFFVLFMFPTCVFAVVFDPGSASGSEASINGGCNTSRFCWNSEGFRVSLYRDYGSEKTTKIGRSHDFWSNSSDSGVTIRNNTNPKFVSLEFDSINKKKTGYKVVESDFSVAASTYRNYDDTRVSYLRFYDIFDHNSNFVRWLNNTNNSVFSTYFDTYDLLEKNLGLINTEKMDIINNKEKYYLVIEVMSSLWAGGNATLPNGFRTKGVNYAGTAYQLSSFYNKHGMIPALAKALYMEDKNVGNFVKKDNSGVLKAVASSDVVNEEYLRKPKSIGLAVYKISDIIRIRTCKDVCGSSPSLTCSSNYCENAEGINTSSKKKKCIVEQCNYKKTFLQSCTSSCPSSNSTNCSVLNRITSSNTVLNPIKSCKQYYKGENNYLEGTEYYYKAECIENNTVSYSSTLPTTINKFSGGFNYYLKLNGNKKCTYTFNKAKYDYERAALLNSEKGSPDSVPEKALRAFQNLKSKENVVDIAKYTNDVTAVLNVNGSKYDDLVVDTENSTSKVDEAKLVADYRATSKASGTTLMSLQPRCYSIRDGSIYKIALGQTCSNDDTLKNYNTFGYFSNSDNDYRTNTVLQIKKKELSTNTYCTLGTDECYFITDDEDNSADCFLTVTDTSGNEADISSGYYKENIRISYTYNKNNILESKIASFCFNGVCNSNPNRYTIVSVPESGSIEKTITGAINYYGSDGNLVVKYCPRTVKLKKDPPPSSVDTCSERYTPTQYAAINEYCRINYSTDRKGYISAEECINDCSTSRLKCKSLYTTNQFEEIVNYCNTSEGKSEYDGSAEKCINDCSRSTTDGKSKYIYRPISLGVSGGTLFPGAVGVYNAFPNRKAGSNWIGYEEKYTKNNPFDGSAIYVIELDSDSIKEIRNNTKSKSEGKNVYFYNDDDTVTSGKYKSKFIETNTDIFVCRNGEGNCNEEGSGW